jgi:hypothetical protein
VEIVFPTVGEVVEVLMVEIIDLERHAEVVRGYHFLTVFSSPLRASSESGNAVRDARLV